VRAPLGIAAREYRCCESQPLEHDFPDREVDEENWELKGNGTVHDRITSKITLMYK